MNANELRSRYIQFFEQKNHHRIPSASLLPENDPSALFTSAGMHPLVPFLLGEPHPLGKRLVGVQKCLRTNDIDEVGDASHLTFFEMLGNWSLGDYFRFESLHWSYEFLTHELGIDPRRLAVTVFAGNGDAPCDEVSAEIWRSLGIANDRIHFLPKDDNWWGPVGATGPCGPDSEIFFDTERPNHPGCRPGCPCGKWLEIWNNVFMEYRRDKDGRLSRLTQPNVDTGMGIERTVTVLQGKADVYEIDTLLPLVQAIEQLSGRKYKENPAPFRVIADHLRAATMSISDGAAPSNVEAGYVVRRIVRRAVRYGRELGLRENFCAYLSNSVIDLLGIAYPELRLNSDKIASILDQEESRFRQTLENGLKQVNKVIDQAKMEGNDEINGKEAFNLFETYGFPLEMTQELAVEAGLAVDRAGFEVSYRAHREQSRLAMDVKFKGGLADHAQKTTRLHTASHLLQAALRRVLGNGVRQMGSNITAERLRFDFAHNERLSDEQLAEVERLVNEQIQFNLPVTIQHMTIEQAWQYGALAFFGEKYGELVKVYTIGDFSKEVCGGPHVSHTGELQHFRISKQEAVSQGVRRIRAILEDD